MKEETSQFVDIGSDDALVKLNLFQSNTSGDCSNPGGRVDADERRAEAQPSVQAPARGPSLRLNSFRVPLQASQFTGLNDLQ